MILVDNALKAREEQGRPVRVAMVGAGFMGQGLTNQIVNSVPGMRMVAVYNRHIKRAFHVYEYSGLKDIAVATTQQELDDAIRAGRPVVTEDAFLLARSEEHGLDQFPTRAQQPRHLPSWICVPCGVCRDRGGLDEIAGFQRRSSRSRARRRTDQETRGTRKGMGGQTANRRLGEQGKG